MLRLLPATNQTCLNQGVAGWKTLLRKGVIELLSTTCNSFICLRFVVEQTREVALNSFAATLYKILRVFGLVLQLSGYKKAFWKAFLNWELFPSSFPTILMETCVFAYPNLNYHTSTRRKHSKIHDLTTTLKLLL